MLVHFLLFIFKFDLIKRNEQAFKVKDALKEVKEKILHHIAVVYTESDTYGIKLSHYWLLSC